MIYEHNAFFYSKKKQDHLFSSRVNLAPKYKRPPLEKLKKKIEDWEYRASLGKTKFKQLHHLIKKFGGVVPFCLAIEMHPDKMIYSWLGITKAGVPRKNCRERYGLVSFFYMLKITMAARHFGVILRPQDMYPDLIEPDGTVKNPMSHPELRSWLRSIDPDIKLQELEHTIALIIQPE